MKIKKFKYQFIALLIVTFFSVLLNPWFGNSQYVPTVLSINLILVFLNLVQKELIQIECLTILVFSTFLLSYFILKVGYSFYANEDPWLRALNNPQMQTTLVNRGVRWASVILNENPTHCIFDLSNNGVINSLTKLPTCSKFIYPIYASQKYEAIMIK